MVGGARPHLLSQVQRHDARRASCSKTQASLSIADRRGVIITDKAGVGLGGGGC